MAIWLACLPVIDNQSQVCPSKAIARIEQYPLICSGGLMLDYEGFEYAWN